MNRRRFMLASALAVGSAGLGGLYWRSRWNYIVGNGNGLGMGEVASDWRRSLHLWGAHLSGRNSMRNFLGIGICVIGNLEEAPMPDAQLQALVGLTRDLMGRCDMPPQNVQGHGMIAGESTKCPGRHFPIEAFRRAL